MKLLISDPDKKWVEDLTPALNEASLPFQVCQNGKECQLMVYQNIPYAVVLDLETTDNSALEVLKYLKMNYSKVKIIFTVNNLKKLTDLSLDIPTLKSLGVSDVLIKPYSALTLIKNVQSNTQQADWKKHIHSEASGKEEEVFEKDEEFTHIKATEFCSGNHAIFDHYIKLSPGKYVKVLHKGERMDTNRIKNYVEVKKVDFFYFKTKDRLTYINYLNEILKKAASSNKLSGQAGLTITRNISFKFVDEVYTNGINPSLVEEGINICEGMHSLLKGNREISAILKKYEEYDPPAQTHLFLTTFFSIIICNNLSWATKRTIQTISIGSFLHDIGKLKLPPELRGLNLASMTPEQLVKYKEHPKHGFELLDKCPIISEAVKQIVFQHHETNDGKGFPYGLNGHKIYPMAKIVALANHFSETIMKEKISPIQGLRKLVEDPLFTHKFDSEIVRSLFLGFSKDKKK